MIMGLGRGVPALLLRAVRTGPSPVVMLVGAVAVGLAWVPFLQVRWAVEGRWRAGTEVRAIRGRFRRAPLAWLGAMGRIPELFPCLCGTSCIFRPTSRGWPRGDLLGLCTLCARGWGGRTAVRYVEIFLHLGSGYGQVEWQ